MSPNEMKRVSRLAMPRCAIYAGCAMSKGITNHLLQLKTLTALPSAIIKMKACQSTSPRRKTMDKRFSLVDSERRFKRACEQIVQLNYKMSDLQSRYSRAKAENHRSFRYSLRLRLAVVEGLRNMYYDYAHNKAQTVADLRREMYGEDVQIISDDMSDSGSDGEY